MCYIYDVGYILDNEFVSSSQHPAINHSVICSISLSCIIFFSWEGRVCSNIKIISFWIESLYPSVCCAEWNDFPNIIPVLGGKSCIILMSTLRFETLFIHHPCPRWRRWFPFTLFKILLSLCFCVLTLWCWNHTLMSQELR